MESPAGMGERPTGAFPSQAMQETFMGDFGNQVENDRLVGMFNMNPQGMETQLHSGSSGNVGMLGLSGGGSSAKPKGIVLPMNSSQRWVIYYDKNGNELQRKIKGPGRLPRGAILEGDNYIVKDCIVNKNTQEVMTVPTYVPPEQRKEKNKTETELFLGFEFLPTNTMAAPMLAGRYPPPRAVRLKASGALEEDNPYAKFRGHSDARPLDKSPEFEAQQQKGSAAYTKRHKSPYLFSAPVPPEDREAYDKGYSLLPGGGRGEYLAPRYQMQGEECYALKSNGAFELLPPGPPNQHQPLLKEAAEAAPVQQVEGEAGDSKLGRAEVTAALELREEPDAKDGAKQGTRERGREQEKGREVKEAEEDVGGGMGSGEKSAGARTSVGVGAVKTDAMQEDVEDADAAQVIALWRSLGAPGGLVEAAPQKRGLVKTEDAGKEEGMRGVGASVSVGVEESGKRPPLLWVEGQSFSVVEVLRVVRGLGGGERVQCWSVVADALLQPCASASANTTVPASLHKFGAKFANSCYGSLASRVRSFYTSTRLDLIESRLAAMAMPLPPSAAAASGEGNDVEMGEASGSKVVGKGGATESTSRTVVLMPTGSCCHFGSELVLLSDGMLHHAEVVRQMGDEECRPTDEMLRRYTSPDRSWEAQKRWWLGYQKFAASRGASPDSPNVSVSSVCGQHKSIGLFTLYHHVMRRGGMEAVIVTKEMSSLMRDLEMRWSPALAFELRRVYVSALYQYEMKEMYNLEITVTAAHELLFCIPIKECTAEGVSAARRRAQLPLHPTTLGIQEGLAGVMGAASGGMKRILERTAGNHAPEDALERQKRICRSLDSRCRDDVTWTLGVLSVSSWEAAKGIEPHVALTDAISGALARFIRAAIFELHSFTGDRFMHVTAASPEENIEANIEAALTVLYNYTCVPHLAPAYSYNGELVAALGVTLTYGGDELCLLALRVLAHMALPRVPEAAPPPPPPPPGPPPPPPPLPAAASTSREREKGKEGDGAAGATGAPSASCMPPFSLHTGGSVAGGESAGQRARLAGAWAPEWFTALFPSRDVSRMCGDYATSSTGVRMHRLLSSGGDALAQAKACPLSHDLLAGLNAVGHCSAGSALFSTYLRVVALMVEVSPYHDAALAELLHTNAVERGLVDLIVPPTPLQAPVFDFIAAAGGGSLAFKYRLSNCQMLVANVVHVLVRDKDGRLQQAYAARALACLLNTDSSSLKTSLMLQEEELIGVTMSSRAAPDALTDMAQILIYFSCVRGGRRFKPFAGAAREAAAAVAAANAAANAAAAAAAAAAGRMIANSGRSAGGDVKKVVDVEEDSDDEDPLNLRNMPRGSGKYRCGVCGQIKKGHVCPGYWVEGEPK